MRYDPRLANTGPDFLEIVLWAALAVLAGIVALGAGLALPGELGARLQHGAWIPISFVGFWEVGWGWITDPAAGGMVGWPPADQASLPSPLLYAVFLAAEILVAIGIIAGLVAALVGHRRNASSPRLSDARGRGAPAIGRARDLGIGRPKGRR
ncbi:MAG: hypothetical protein ACREQM_13515 [Candidatus Dormibacteraceae bacterium]